MMTEDIKFKLITYVDTDFEAKTQKCEYFIELEDGVERSLKDILIENARLKEYKDVGDIMCDQKCMTVKNAKRFRMQAGMIIDDLTGKHYTTLQQCCKLLNQVSDRADRNAELYYAIPKGIRDVWLDD